MLIATIRTAKDSLRLTESRNVFIRVIPTGWSPSSSTFGVLGVYSINFPRLSTGEYTWNSLFSMLFQELVHTLGNGGRKSGDNLTNARESAGKRQKHVVQFHQVGVDAIEAGAPFRVRLLGVHLQNGKVALLPLAICKTGEFLAKIDDRSRRGQMLAIFAIQNCPQHALILRVRLAKIEARHTPSLSAVLKGTLMVPG